MAGIVIYSSPYCPYCFRAKDLLDDKGAAYEEIDVFHNPERRREMVARAGGRTSVPQIFVGDRHVGGSDELIALERAGELDALLAGAA